MLFPSHTKHTPKFTLSKTILATSIAVALMPSVHASVFEVQGELPSISSSMPVKVDGKDIFTIHFFDKDKEIRVKDSEKGKSYSLYKSTYTLNDDLKNAVKDGIQYWADIIAKGVKQPVNFLVFTNNDVNASAWQLNQIGDNKLQSDTIDWFINATSGKVTVGNYDGAYIDVGIFDSADTEHKGFSIPFDSQLPSQDWSQATLSSILFHEVGHALGIASPTEQWQFRLGESAPVPYNDRRFYLFAQFLGENNSFDSSAPPDQFSSHLIDSTGKQAKAGMIVLPKALIPYIKNNIQGFKDLMDEEVFIINDPFSDNTDSPAYFTGKYVQEVLNGAQLEYGINKRAPGIPIGLSETYRADANYYRSDVTHLFLRNGLMSHLFYRNYNTFMEAEYAVVQDLGYSFDRRDFFGYSVYNDDLIMDNFHGYSKRNPEGTAYIPGEPNASRFGVGLHIYGSRNTITQKADILSNGLAGIGIRVDGLEKNHLIVDKGVKVYADGLNGNGLLVAYGNNHTIKQLGDVRARGNHGVGARFDFGDNATLDTSEYRGSYIWLENQKNVSLHDPQGDFRLKQAHTELEGALVKQFDIAGHLEGAEQAIYISPNAYVQEINVLDGATIIGDIRSDWRHFSEKFSSEADKEVIDSIQIQIPEPMKAQGVTPNDLNTQLNFKSNISYQGNITGRDNIQMNVMGTDEYPNFIDGLPNPITVPTSPMTDSTRTLNYQGHAQVLGVHVYPHGVLRGGNYTLGEKQFINRGTIGAGADGSSLVIRQGNLDSREGTLLYTATGVTDTAPIQVLHGNANIDKATVLMAAQPQYTPLSDYKVLDAKAISGKASLVVQGLENNQTGLLSGALVLNSADGATATARGASTTDKNIAHNTSLTAPNTIAIRFTPSNNLGNGSSAIQNDTFNAITATLTANNAFQLAPLYNLNRAQAKAALTDLYGGLRADMGNTIKFDRFPVDTMQSRLDDTHAPQGAWVVLDKTKGNLNRRHDLTKVHTDTHHFAIGLDRQLNPNWLVGGMFSYGHHKLTNRSATGKAEDWRFNLYARYGQPYHLNWDMYMGYGWQNHDVSRGIRYLNDKIDGHYDSHLFNVGTRVSKLLPLGKSDSGWGLRPYVGVDVARYSQETYTEKSRGDIPAAFTQHIAHKTDTLVSSSLGVKLTKTFTDKGEFNLGIAYRRLLEGENTSLTVHHSPTVTQSIRGQGFGKNIFSANLQGAVYLGKNTLLQAKLGGEFARGVRQYNGQMNLLWRF